MMGAITYLKRVVVRGYNPVPVARAAAGETLQPQPEGGWALWPCAGGGTTALYGQWPGTLMLRGQWQGTTVLR